jgi:hypothetical protein
MIQRRLKRKKDSEKKKRKAKLRRIKMIRNYTLLVLVLAGGAVGFYLLSTGVGKPGRHVPNLGNQHIPNVNSNHEAYNSDPPTSGPHVTDLAEWGIHEKPISKEIQVHNLEHGGIIIQYNRSADSEIIYKLAEITRGYKHGVILAPYKDLDSLIALTAWKRIDTLNQFDEERVERFIKAYHGIDRHGH